MADLFDALDNDKTPAKPAKGAPAAAASARPKAENENKPARKAGGNDSYTAKDIEVLEGLEPVRKRPGMYIGGTDERALHHLITEILDNAMDEAVAGHATRIGIELPDNNTVIVRDNGRGIPVDPHPKYKNKSALEVIMTTLHSGGKFSNKSYQTAGGLHGVGISVVNALSEKMTVEVARDGTLYRQEFSRGLPTSKLATAGKAAKGQRGTTVMFQPDPDIFGDHHHFKAGLVYRMVRAKAFLFRGVEIDWRCAPSLIPSHGDEKIPEQETIHFPNGLADYMLTLVEGRQLLMPAFSGTVESDYGKVEWSVAWPFDDEGTTRSYCNTIPTPQGGTHESGLRTALTAAAKNFADLAGEKEARELTSEDITGGAVSLLSVFIPNPQFQGQTKDKLATAEAQKLVETAVRDRFEHFLSQSASEARQLLARFVERLEERKARKKAQEQKRKTATGRARLPGKLVDCINKERDGTELFIVEGDSAGGSAKQARNPHYQAVLPLRGKILNVGNANLEKMMANKELSDLILAMGCGWGKDYDESKLRYEKIIIMTDADVDGAHISSLLMTFFYTYMPKIIEEGHLYLALPPLFRMASKEKTMYAQDEAERNDMLNTHFKGQKVEISRFKGLGEMPPRYLKETTMDRSSRTLLRVDLYDAEAMEKPHETKRLVEDLMGKSAESRFRFIQENAQFAENIDV